MRRWKHLVVFKLICLLISVMKEALKTIAFVCCSDWRWLACTGVCQPHFTSSSPSHPFLSICTAARWRLFSFLAGSTRKPPSGPSGRKGQGWPTHCLSVISLVCLRQRGVFCLWSRPSITLPLSPPFMSDAHASRRTAQKQRGRPALVSACWSHQSKSSASG